MKHYSMKRIDFLILFVIITIAVLFRLYKIDTPLADLHSWRQVDTAAVARNFVKDGFNLLSPRYDDFSNIQSGKENPQGLRFVEFPLYNALFGYLYKTIGLIPLEVYGRLTSVFFSLLIIAIIYYLLLHEVGRWAAFIGSLVYAVFPFFVFFSRVVLPETAALSLTFCAIFFLYLFSQSKKPVYSFIFYLLSLAFFAFGVLVMPMVVFYALALAYLFYKKYRWQFLSKIQVYLFFIIASIPFLLWRQYITHFPEGVPENTWLFFLTNSFEGKKVIFFKPAFFRWIFFERINNLILGGFLTILFVLGIIRKHKNLFLPSLALSALLYLLVFQGGNVQHEYYQTLILPALAILVGLGVDFFVKARKLFINSAILYTAIIFIFAFSFYFSFYRVRDYYNYSQDTVFIAKIIKSLTNENDKIITDTTGDTTLLYLAERRGSPAPYKEFEEFKKEGYSYFVTLKSEVIEAKKKENKYKLIFENNKFAMFRL